MRNPLRHDSPIMEFLGNMADLIILNLLWIIFSLPIITIGASSVALYSTTRKLAANNWVPVFKAFLTSFRANFKQGTSVLFMMLVPMLIALLDFSFLVFDMLNGNIVLKGICVVTLMLIVLPSSYIFPLVAHFDNSSVQTVKNSFVFAFAHPIKSLVMAALNYIPVVLLAIVPAVFFRVFIIWLGIGFSLVAFVNSKILNPIFYSVTVKSN